jgi:hypothetical protein
VLVIVAVAAAAAVTAAVDISYPLCGSADRKHQQLRVLPAATDSNGKINGNISDDNKLIRLTSGSCRSFEQRSSTAAY